MSPATSRSTPGAGQLLGDPGPGEHRARRLLGAHRRAGGRGRRCPAATFAPRRRGWRGSSLATPDVEHADLRPDRARRARSPRPARRRTARPSGASPRPARPRRPARARRGRRGHDHGRRSLRDRRRAGARDRGELRAERLEAPEASRRLDETLVAGEGGVRAASSGGSTDAARRQPLGQAHRVGLRRASRCRPRAWQARRCSPAKRSRSASAPSSTTACTARATLAPTRVAGPAKGRARAGRARHADAVGRGPGRPAAGVGGRHARVGQRLRLGLDRGRQRAGEAGVGERLVDDDQQVDRAHSRERARARGRPPRARGARRRWRPPRARSRRARV